MTKLRLQEVISELAIVSLTKFALVKNRQKDSPQQLNCSPFALVLSKP